MKIHRSLGCGFLESVYQSALTHELQNAGLSFEQNKRLEVFYEDKLVGLFEADIVINADQPIIIELKAVENLSKAHEAQLVNYLTATRIDNGLLLNFGNTSLQYRRKYRHYKPKDF